MGNVLVYAETKDRTPAKEYADRSFRPAKRPPASSGGDVLVAVLGAGVEGAAQEAAGYGATKVLAVDDPALANYLADAYAAALEQLVSRNEVSLLLATSTAQGKDMLPRVAARLNVGMASDIVGINDDGTFQRPMYAGNRDCDGIAGRGGAGRVVCVARPLTPPSRATNRRLKRLMISLEAADQQMRFVSSLTRSNPTGRRWPMRVLSFRVAGDSSPERISKSIWSP